MTEQKSNGRCDVGTCSETDTCDALIHAIEHMPMAVGLFYKDGSPIFMNRNFRELHRYFDHQGGVGSFADILKSGFLTGWATDPEDYFANALRNLLETGEHRAQLEVDGRFLDIHDVLVDDHLIISTQKDITQRIMVERHTAYLASHDMMTGLANRLSFEAQLKQTIEMSSETGGRFSVLMADLDRFKQINDTYGHAAGDAVLKEIACRFRASLGHGDFVARLGGDEFVFLCRDDEAHAQALATRLVASGAQPILYEDKQLSVGVSVGYSVFPEHGDNQEQLLRAADAALYQVKSLTRGAVQRYSTPDHAA